MEVGDRVLQAFSELKAKNSACELKRIDRHYYVYLSYVRKDAATGRKRKISTYQGKITDEGEFVAKRSTQWPSPVQVELEGVRSAPNFGDAGSGSAQGERSNRHEKTLLTALSMNGRISLPALARMTGLSVNATAWQKKSLERKYGIRYVPEIDAGKFGYMQLLVTVKFINGIPPTEELRSAMLLEPRVQLAMLAKGEYDVILHVLVKNVEEANLLIVNLRNRLGTYDSVWSVTPVYEDYGFVPFRSEFIDLLKEEGGVRAREYAVLRELNDDASVEFSKIDEKYGFDAGRASYTYHTLRSEGKIKRTTITMRKLPIRYIGVIFKCITNRVKFSAKRHESLSNIIWDNGTQTNRYLCVYDTISPDGSVIFMPVFEYDELDKAVEELTALDMGVKLSTLVASNMLVGNFCYRRFDNAHSVQQKILESQYGRDKTERIDYESTGRKKAAEPRLDIRGARVLANSEAGPI